ncbi:hypothetical protein SH661x_003252 [Planctomicrobium sp. SH661]|uniref:hypothetical protein n=1 Tax=Planctomicrobium sp. SH661 TaxID=3448124 RepID=UPI003F5BDCDF
MEYPIDRFDRALNALSEEIRLEVLDLCYYALGKEPERIDAEEAGEAGTEDLYKPIEVSDVCQHLAGMVEETGAAVDFLIPGLFTFLIEHFEWVNDPEAIAVNDHDARTMLESLEIEIRKPEKLRLIPSSTEEMQELITELKNSIEQGPDFRAWCAEAATALRTTQQQFFSRNYWSEWRDHLANEASEELFEEEG